MPSSPRSSIARFAASCEDGRRETLRVGGRMAADLRAARGRRPEGFGQGCGGGLPGARAKALAYRYKARWRGLMPRSARAAGFVAVAKGFSPQASL